MGYSENRKNYPSTKINDLYSDGCGDRYENKHYYNGFYIDLCGMSIEDYMTNPCCNCGGNGSTDSDPKINNRIIVKYTKQENGDIYYKAYASYAVASYIKVTITFSDNTVTELDLNAGNKESESEKGSEPQFNSIKLNITEDNDYKYNVVMESSKITYKIYNKAVLLSEFEKETFTVDDSFTVNAIENGKTLDITFSIPATDKNLTDSDLTEEELYEIYKTMEHCFVLCLPKSIYDSGKYSIKTEDGMDITNNFVDHKEDLFMINKGEYVFLDERSSNGEIEPYVPNYNEVLSYNYKLILNK